MNRLGLILIVLSLLVVSPTTTRGQIAQVDSLLQLVQDHPEPDTHRVLLLRTLAYSYYTIDIEETETYSEEILEISRDLNYPRGLAFGHQLLGVVNAVKGNYTQALERYLTALNIQKAEGDIRGRAGNLNNIAGVYYYQGDIDKALEYNQQSLMASQELEDTLAMASGYLARGMMQAEIDQLDKALINYQLALNLYQSQNDLPRLSSAYREIGEMFEQKGQLREAYQYYQKSLEIADQTQATSSKAYTYINLGGLAEKQGRLSEAERSYERGLEFAQQSGVTEIEKSAYMLLARLAEKQGQTRRALSYMDLYVTLSDSLYDVNIRERLASVEDRYETEQARQELELLRKEKELQDAQITAQDATIRSQTLLVGVIIVGLIFLAIIIVVLYRHNQTRKYANHELNSQKRELEKKTTELEALNQTKDRWFTILGDDFRYPLHFLQHALSLVNEGNLSDKERDMLTKELEVRARNTGNLFDNLLFWAQGQLNNQPWNPTYLNLKDEVDQAIDQIQFQADAKHVEIEVNVAEDLQIYAAQECIQVAIRNIVQNAIKFSYKGGRIEVAASPTGAFMNLTVKDQGMGISANDRAKLFNPDQPFTTRGTAGEPGTGIGLILTKDIMNRNRGKVALASESGKGTTVIMAIPVRPSPEPTPSTSEETASA